MMTTCPVLTQRVPCSIRAAFCLFVTLVIVVAPTTPPVHAQTVAVDLELVLAVDVSGSIDPVEARLQREGYMGALASDRVIEAIQAGVLGRIALTYVEWAGYDHHSTLIDWQIIANRADMNAFVGALGEAPLRRARRTSLSGAIEYAMPKFAENDIESTRQVIDISGDGPNNSGPMLPAARDAAVAAGIVINGLPIINDRPNPFGLRTMRNLDLYFEHCVIGGPGAFLVVAESFDDFASAVLSKLILEIADIRPAPTRLRRHAGLQAAPRPRPVWPPVATGVPRLWRVQATDRGLVPPPAGSTLSGGLPGAPARQLPEGIANCDAGERQWQQFRQGFDTWP